MEWALPSDLEHMDAGHRRDKMTWEQLGCQDSKLEA